MVGVLVGSGGCMQILWTAAVAPGLIATRLSDRSSKVAFRLLDADDGAPIVGADLQLHYLGDWYTPRESSKATTDAGGVAVLKVIHGYRFELTLRADGYVLTPEDVPASAFADPPPKRVEIRLRYAKGWVRDRPDAARVDEP